MSGLDALGRLVGAWEIEASHPMLEAAVRRRIELEWLEGEKFCSTGRGDDQASALYAGLRRGGCRRSSGRRSTSSAD
jgi:hypothetical protein